MALLKRVLTEPKLPALLDHGYQVLIYKDHLASNLKPPTYTAYIPRKPTAQEFQSLMEEFWWESISINCELICCKKAVCIITYAHAE